MKGIIVCFFLFLFAHPVSLSGQSAQKVLDSLSRPLPAGATARAQAERLENILWLIFIDWSLSFDHYPKQLDSLYHCCIAGKTGDTRVEKKIEAEVSLFQGAAMLYDNPQAAQGFFEKTLSPLYRIGDSATLSIAYMYICQVAISIGDSLAFARAYDRSMPLSSYIKNPEYLAMVYNNLGISCYQFGRYAEAADLYFKILDLTDKHPTPIMLDGKASTYYNIAGVYKHLGDYENAMLYANKAIETAQETKEELIDFFFMAGETLKQQQHYREALAMYLRVNEAASTSQNLRSMGVCIAGMATCYRELGNLGKALPLARKAVEMLPITKEYSHRAAALLELAHCEFESNLNSAALQHALLSYKTYSEATHKVGSANAAALLVSLYEAQGNHRKALEYSELRYKYQSQVERQQSNRQLAFGEFTRDNATKTARREAEVKAQLDQQRNIRYALFAGLAVLALLAVLLYNRFRFKQKTTQQLETKNREVEAARLRAEQERARAEQERRRAEASEAFKSRFLANMSHEIRTPLHGISGFTDLLLETSLSEKQRRWLSSIHHSTDRLGEVVNDILDLSKLEAGEVKLRQIPFSPARVAEDVQEALSLRAENKGIELTLKVDENVPEALLGDPTRLYQILMNLAGNAVKFTEQGRVTLAIEEVTPSHPLNTETIQFKVTDTGIGIPPEKLASIFDSFQQAGEDTTARFGGTGLGLTIARELVQLHNSDIQVESQVGKGSTFSFVLALPLADAEALEMKSTKGDTLYFTQPLRILLADDNSLNLEIATEAIRRHFENAVVVEARNGKEAVALFQSGTFDLILMDMQMPEMTGTEATRHIRQQLSSDIPIIALTASATPEEIENALESGMNRHLGKPFKPRELALVVAEVMGLDGSVPAALAAGSQSIPAAKATGTDLAFLRDFCDGDEAQMRHFIQKFLDQYPLEIRRLEAALEQGDREMIYQAAHSFRPQLEFVGLKKATLLANAIELEARKGESLKLSMFIKELAECLNDVLPSIKTA